MHQALELPQMVSSAVGPSCLTDLPTGMEVTTLYPHISELKYLLLLQFMDSEFQLNRIQFRIKHGYFKIDHHWIVRVKQRNPRKSKRTWGGQEVKGGMLLLCRCLWFIKSYNKSCNIRLLMYLKCVPSWSLVLHPFPNRISLWSNDAVGTGISFTLPTPSNIYLVGLVLYVMFSPPKGLCLKWIFN